MGEVIYRCVDESDWAAGLFDVLRQLTAADKVEFEVFKARLEEIDRNEDYEILVALLDGRVVGCASLLIERKFIRGCGKVGHVEDVVVDASVRGRGVGKRLVDLLTKRAFELGCYKAILDCSEDNVRFYERCGFKRKEVQMVLYR